MSRNFYKEIKNLDDIKLVGDYDGIRIDLKPNWYRSLNAFGYYCKCGNHSRKKRNCTCQFLEVSSGYNYSDKQDYISSLGLVLPRVDKIGPMQYFIEVKKLVLEKDDKSNILEIKQLENSVVLDIEKMEMNNLVVDGVITPIKKQTYDQLINAILFCGESYPSDRKTLKQAYFTIKMIKSANMLIIDESRIHIKWSKYSLSGIFKHDSYNRLNESIKSIFNCPLVEVYTKNPLALALASCYTKNYSNNLSPNQVIKQTSDDLLDKLELVRTLYPKHISSFCSIYTIMKELSDYEISTIFKLHDTLYCYNITNLFKEWKELLNEYILPLNHEMEDEEVFLKDYFNRFFTFIRRHKEMIYDSLTPSLKLFNSFEAAAKASGNPANYKFRDFCGEALLDQMQKYDINPDRLEYFYDLLDNNATLALEFISYKKAITKKEKEMLIKTLNRNS